MSLPEDQDLSQFATLVKIIARLRAPGGCPWDRKQSHASLRENLLEECYEVLAALDGADAPKLCAELGDLLMQIVFHAQIATETGELELGYVMRPINTKLIHRHPHILGDKKGKVTLSFVLPFFFQTIVMVEASPRFFTLTHA